MFTIVISEKGGSGASRRPSSATRSPSAACRANDLMLPKGNVSKQHARLLFRDARFIVTDLKSTNGTYVNGRKIAQATIVREGDKIYIGDFVLRVETGQGHAPPGRRPRLVSRLTASRAKRGWRPPGSTFEPGIDGAGCAFFVAHSGRRGVSPSELRPQPSRGRLGSASGAAPGAFGGESLSSRKGS